MQPPFADLALHEIFDDLSTRFIINVPPSELESVERVCFQIEQAHWFYEDFVRVENPSLPSFALKAFCAQFFARCPLLHEWAGRHEQAFETFRKYKFGVPVCGAILLPPSRDRVLLVRGWNSRTWAFPRGKINKDEPYVECALREVLEETGFDARRHLVLRENVSRLRRTSVTNANSTSAAAASSYSSAAQKPSNPRSKSRSKAKPGAKHNASSDAVASGSSAVADPYAFIERKIKEQRIRLYIAENVPLDFSFATRTRKEISGIEWHAIDDLPGFSRGANSKKSQQNQQQHQQGKPSTKYYTIVPFINALREYLSLTATAAPEILASTPAPHASERAPGGASYASFIPNVQAPAVAPSAAPSQLLCSPPQLLPPPTRPPITAQESLQAPPAVSRPLSEFCFDVPLIMRHFDSCLAQSAVH